MKLTFKLEEGEKSVTLISDSIVLEDVIEDFQDFLSGCGYSFKGQSITLTEDDE